MLRYMVLGLLRWGECMHGYALWKAYEARSGRRMENGKFYRALKELADAGFIRPMAAPQSDPRRTPYEITPPGRAAFDQWLGAFDGMRGATDDTISSRALFVFDLPADVAEAFFLAAEGELSACWKWTEHERERILTRPGISDRDRLVQSLLTARKLERASADLTWLRETRAAYEQLGAVRQARGPAASAPKRHRISARAG